MTWQKWIIRGLFFLALALIPVGVGLYRFWTNPAAVRQLVQEQLGVKMMRVGVQVGSARMRLLGGILVRELRLGRADALDRQDFLYIPQAVLYHDKEQLLQGKLTIRKVELDQPELRIIRQRDGQLNLSGIMGPVDLSERIPTTVIRQGSIHFDCRQAGPGSVLEIRKIQATLINDPMPTVRLEGTGEIDVLGPVQFLARMDRVTNAVQLEVKLPDISIGKSLLERVCRYFPLLRSHVEHFSAKAEITLHFHFPGTGKGTATHDLQVHLHHGTFSHPCLPDSLNKIDFVAKIHNGLVTEAVLNANCGHARGELRFKELRCEDLATTPLCCPDSLVKELDLRVENLTVNGNLIRKLPEELHDLEREYSPDGPANIQYTFRRAGVQPVVKLWTLEPQGMTASYAGFPYGVKNLRGKLIIDQSQADHPKAQVDLTAEAGDGRASLRGTLEGKHGTGPVNLELVVTNALLDGKVMKGVPEKIRRVAQQFLPADSRKDGLDKHPMGWADILATFVRLPGQKEIDKRYTIHVKRARVLYDQFPYPLENVSGQLLIFPDHWECRQGRGYHAGGEIRVEARSIRVPPPRGQALSGENQPTEQVQVSIQGSNIRLDHEFESALVPLNAAERKHLQQTWKALRLNGRLNFTAEIFDTMGMPQDIDVSVNIRSCRIRPRFFDYDLDQVSGRFRYAHQHVHLRDIRARHGLTQIHLSSGLIRLGVEGGFSAWLNGLTAQNLNFNADLLRAVPESLRSCLETLKFQTPVDLATRLTLVSHAAGNGTLEAWWEGAVGMRQARFTVGLPVTDATGQFYCKGYHDGRRLRGATGQIQLERVRILDQPVKNLFARMDMESNTPDTLRIRDLRADLFGGAIAGQMRVDLAPTLKYDVLLEALGIQLAELGKHNMGQTAQEAQLNGPLRASIHLHGEGKEMLGLKGNGLVDIHKGKMGQLPVLLDLLKAFGFHYPDRTAFEQAHMKFDIEGPQMLVRQLDLFGNAISLRGEGSLDLDGSNLNLDFNLSPGKTSLLMPRGVVMVPELVFSQFLKIKMRGKLGKGNQVRFDREWMPGVVEPLRRVMWWESYP